MMRRWFVAIAVAALLLGTTIESAAASGTWTTKAPLPTPREAMATVTLGGMVCVIGGNSSAGSLALVECYDPATDTWSARTPMPTAKWICSAAVIDGIAYVLGDDTLVYAYDPQTDTWSSRAPIPQAPVREHGTAAVNGKLYVSESDQWMYEYDPSTDVWTSKTPMPVARNYISSFAALGGKIYAIGGAEPGHVPSEVSRVDVYDPATDSWQIGAIPDMPTARTHLARTTPVVDNKIWVIGGWNGYSALHTVEVYDPVSNSWSTDTPMPTARYQMGLAAVGNKIYAVGGNWGGAGGHWQDVNEELSVPWSGSTVTASVTSGSEIYPGDLVTVALGIQGANNLYGAQMFCSVDPVVLEPQSAAFGDFFDPVNRLVGANEISPTVGTWLGAISQRSPAGPLYGDGLLATVTYQASSPGTTPIACDPLLSDRNGFTQTVSFAGINVTVLPFATISGTATYQGRLTHAGIAVTATGPVTRTDSTDTGGGFVLGELRAGSYDVVADAGSYLPNCTSATVGPGDEITLPATTLLGGDVNDDGTINIGDATLIGSNFGQSVPPADTRADINADLVVNVQDLAILGGNYELAGCQPW